MNFNSFLKTRDISETPRAVLSVLLPKLIPLFELLADPTLSAVPGSFSTETLDVHFSETPAS